MGLGGGYVRVSHVFEGPKNWALSQYIGIVEIDEP